MRQRTENKYNLQILTNRYRTPEQIQGNGLSNFLILNRFEEDNIDFRIQAYLGNFYLEIGNNKQYKLIRKLRVQGEDMNAYEMHSNVILKYANELIDWYYEEYRDENNKDNH